MPLSAQTVTWNLVKNYSFEDYLRCDTAGIFPYSNPILPFWYSATELGSPDYFNRCRYHNVYDYQDVPLNGIAYQETRIIGSNGYTGIITTDSYGSPVCDREYREYLQTKLSKPLKHQKKYCVGMYVNLAFDVNGVQNIVKVTKDLGVLLTKDRVMNNNTADTQPITITANPQIKPTHYLEDTLNWEKVSSIIVGQDDEEWLTIGVFKPDWQAQDSMIYSPPAAHLRTYYFIDDVFVIPMENEEALLHKDTAICANNFPLQLTANQGFTDYEWNNGTHSSSIQINQAGTYTVSATYAGCTIIDTVQVKLKAPPNAFQLPQQLYCNQNLPTVYTLPDSISAIYSSFVWSSGGQGNSVNITQSGSYTVSASSECGTVSTTLLVTAENALPDFSLGRDTASCLNGHFVPIALHAPIGYPNYHWNTGETTRSITATQPQSYTVSSENLCGEVSSRRNIEGCAPSYYLPNTFTPNGDGKNDFFTLYSNDAVRIIKQFQVFDRYGELVFWAENIAPNDERKGWDGSFKGMSFTPDVFAYRITVEYADGTTETLVGDVTVVK
jgi:gliding motility-associated-like protein